MRLSENQKNIIKLIGGLLLVGTAFVAPNILQILKPTSPKERYKHKRTIQKLFNDEVIFLSGEKIELTDIGKKLLKQIQVEDIIINDWHNRPDWDSVWHLVCYDIPEKFKKERDHFRSENQMTASIIICRHWRVESTSNVYFLPTNRCAMPTTRASISSAALIRFASRPAWMAAIAFCLNTSIASPISD